MHELLPVLLDAFGDREAIYLNAGTGGSGLGAREKQQGATAR
jgi:hypothetical protein